MKVYCNAKGEPIVTPNYFYEGFESKDIPLFLRWLFPIKTPNDLKYKEYKNGNNKNTCI